MQHGRVIILRRSGVNRRIIRTIISFLTGMLCMLSGFESICASVSEGSLQQVDLNLFLSGTDVSWSAAVQQICDSFMKENPGITIHTECSEGNDWEEELKIKIALDTFPDIFELKDITAFAEAGELGSISSDAADLLEAPIFSGDTVYGLPIYAVTNGIIYNKNIFRDLDLEIPSTFREFLEVCKQLQEEGVTPLAACGSNANGLLNWLNYFFRTDVIGRDSSWISRRNAGEVSFQDQTILLMLEDFKTLMESGYFLKDSLQMSEYGLIRSMIDGDFAMIYADPWLLTKIADAYPLSLESDKDRMGNQIDPKEDTVTFRLGWFFLGNEDGKATVLTENAACWAISSSCEKDRVKYDAACRFLRYFYQRENYRNVLKEMYGLPVTKEAVIYPGPEVERNLLRDYRYSDKGDEYIGNPETPAGVSDNFNTLLKEFASGEITIFDTAEAMDEMWDTAG